MRVTFLAIVAYSGAEFLLYHIHISPPLSADDMVYITAVGMLVCADCTPFG